MGSALVAAAIRWLLLAVAVYLAYDIRLYAVKDFGRLIHEFDPWFNFHATRYLLANGAAKFFKWFDHTVWYPLGRPVGTTIYPGMQFTAVYIYHALQRLGMPMSLNDVCVFVPAWFGGVASVITGFLAAETSGCDSASPAAALIMAIIPAHIMRSVAGGYDNESIANTTMVLTFWLWVRSVRTKHSWPIAVLAALAYFYMVTAWGGYVFVINTVGAHAGLLWLLGRFDASVYKAYTIFFVIGTALAVQIPVVNWTPLKSMEQIMPLSVFLFYQILFAFDLLCAHLGYEKGSSEALALRRKFVLAAGGAVGLVLATLMQLGHFQALSGRVRGLFVKHMRTGNPLVDSVAEHQPTSPDAYYSYLHSMCIYAPIGWFLLMRKITNGKLFMLMYAAFGYFFSSKMNRLIILMGPIASALGGIALGTIADWVIDQRFTILGGDDPAAVQKAGTLAMTATPATKGSSKDSRKEGRKDKKGTKHKDSLEHMYLEFMEWAQAQYTSEKGRTVRLMAAALVSALIASNLYSFFGYCDLFSQHSSNPSLVFKARTPDGRTIVLRDYLDSYEWLDANTPADARVLSWWDYGYQISGIANRTTLADGNTWNHDHIALIGRMLTSEESKAHKLIRHVADYVLVWAGGGGDDLAKSPHMARIGNSVYPDMCPGDPMCYSLSIQPDNTPTPRMAASLLYKMCQKGKVPGVIVNEELFKEVFSSKYGKVRIYEVQNVDQESRAWLADPANYECDRPGSWYCPGQYPPKFPLKIRKGHAELNYDKHGKPGREM